MMTAKAVRSLSFRNVCGCQDRALALTGVSQSVTRQLLKNADSPDTLVDWLGEDDAGLKPDAYTTQTTTDAIGAVLSTQDAAGHKQRLCYDVAGQLAGSLAARRPRVGGPRSQ
ncbi:hypothetical protein IRZ59_20155 [Pseudomonas guariconensis]|uniref:hypothetical protein n=1 Tax=Pseudomonas guariconensis TaxID=1288410 RepID=UPI0018AB5948|nr:hypothetical protein [Pseudomonas guariconensis]MBF8732751.1 hypothetical protein [Pseudomonas guariconensis]